jgi:hypothetical protein
MEKKPPMKMPEIISPADWEREFMLEPMRISEAKRQKTPVKKRLDEAMGIVFQLCDFSSQEPILCGS